MIDRLLRIGLVLLAGLALAAVPSLARDHGFGKERGKAKWERRDRDEDFDRDDDTRFRRVMVFPRVERIHRRDSDDFDRDDGRFGRIVIFPRTVSPEHRPPGWDRGRKVGWGDCDVPPGLAKKEGCHHLVFGRGRHGRPHRIHRPVVVIQP